VSQEADGCYFVYKRSTEYLPVNEDV